MKCPNCQFESPFNLKFCGQCGGRLKQFCTTCGFGNPLDFKFCGNCGAPAYQDTSLQVPSKNTDHPAPALTTERDAERRHLTVMFCDLVGSTALSARLDPEDLQYIVKEYQRVCQKVVARFEGHIAQYLGDGILVYFGYPIAHENDAHRAVSTGLGIIEAMEQLNLRLEAEKGIKIQLRIGIHTGHTVIGAILDHSGQHQRLAHGATLNIAARLEGLAQPDTMVISDVTFGLVHRHFVCEDKGEHSVKGIDKPIKIYQVIRENTARARLENQQNLSNQLPLFGREKELSKLLELWEAAKESRSHIVLLNGEAGVGKSRLLLALTQQVADDPDAWLIVNQCSPYHQKTAFYPFTVGLKQLALNLEGHEPAAEQINRLEGFLLQNGLSLEEMTPIFAGVMDISLEGSNYRASPYSLAQQHEKIVHALVAMFLERAKKQPLLVTFEDLHWIDEFSLKVLDKLIQQSPTSRLLTILSFRSTFKVPWRMQEHLVPVSLSKLSDKAIRTIIHNLSGGKRLPEPLILQIIQKTDGVPLFIEELTKMVLNSDMVKELDTHFELTNPIESLAIPSTLQDSLVARLNNMAHTKTVAQIGASIGREFSFELIKISSGMEEGALQRALEELVQITLLLQQGVLPNATFKFRHALIQDAAYQSLLNSQKKKIHQKIAESLSLHFEEQVEHHPQIAAYHYEKAGQTMEAITFWTKAGERARNRQNFTEALDYLRRGLELIPQLEDNKRRQQLELALLRIQAPIFFITQGYSSKPAFRASIRMQELAESLSDNISLFRALRNKTTHQLFAETTQSALQSAQQALVVAQDEGDKDLLIEAYRMVGQACIYVGKYQQSIDSFNRSIDLYLAKDGPMHHRFIGGDPFIMSLVQSGYALWYLGYPEQAIQRAEKALEKANAVGQIINQTLCLFITCFLTALRRDTKACEKYTNTVHKICKEYGFQQILLEAEIYRGYLLLKNGQIEKGSKHLETAFQQRLQRKTFNGFHVHVQAISYAYLELGKWNAGLDLIAKSFEILEITGDQSCLSEIYRLKGELLFGKDKKANLAEIEQCYQTSWQLAQAQGAKSLELRTAMSMARLGQYKNTTETAHQRLSETYEWFSEGFDTADLQEAKILLSTMA